MEHLGQFTQAENLYTKLLGVSERFWGNESPGTLQALHDLGGMHFAKGEYDKAIPLLEQALAIRKKVLGETMDATLLTRLNLGLSFLSSGDSRTEPFLVEMLEFQERIKGRDSVEIEGVLTALGTHYARERKFEAAKPLFQRAADIAEKKLGPFHPRTLRNIINLGNVFLEQDLKGEARDLWLLAYDRIRKASGNLLHLRVNQLRANIIIILIEEGDFKRAAPLVIDDLTELSRLVEHIEDPYYFTVQPDRPEGPIQRIVSVGHLWSVISC